MGETTAKATVLKGGDEVKEDKARKCLQGDGLSTVKWGTETSETHHGLFTSRHVVVRKGICINK